MPIHRREDRGDAPAREEPGSAAWPMGAEQAQRYLGPLYEISKLFTSFETVELTFDTALRVVARALPLRSAILLEFEEERFKMSVWPSDWSGAELHEARTHIEAAYTYLAGAASSGELQHAERATMSALSDRSVQGRPLQDKRYIVVPLVIARRPIFGALQVEAAGVLDEADLAFVSAIAGQLAIALDRDRARRRDIARRERAESGRADAEARGASELERRRSAEALTERYEALVDNLDHAFVWEADVRDFRVRYVSARAESLLGYERQQWLQSDWWAKVVHPDDRAALLDAFRLAVAEQRDQRCDHRCTARDGRTWWFHTRVHLMSSDEGEPRLQGVSFDVTPAKEAEALAARSFVELQHAVRVREHILAVVSHDLRTPLSTILMAVARLARRDTEGSDPAAFAPTLERIQRAAASMQRLIGDLLDFASIEAGRLSIRREQQDAASILREAAASFESAAQQKALELTTEIEPVLPQVSCDRDRVLQVLTNLVGNASKVTATGGHIVLQVRRRGPDVMFSVSDDGPGISEGDQAHLFERYWRSGDARYRGTGLGLAIARGIVEAHGGQIWVESQPGRGSTFSFTIPAGR